MVDEFRVLGLCDVALRLDLDPFEITRLLVLAGRTHTDRGLSEDDLEAIHRTAGLEWWWEGSVELPEDDNPRRAVLRAAIGQLLERGVVDRRATRIDNLWRGLEAEEQELLKRLAATLIKEGLLATRTSAQGVQIAVTPAGVATLDAVVQGEREPAFLAALC